MSSAVQDADGALDTDALAEDGECAGDEPQVPRPVEREEVTVRNGAVEDARRIRDDGALVHLERLRDRRRQHVREREDRDTPTAIATTALREVIAWRACSRARARARRLLRSLPGRP